MVTSAQRFTWDETPWVWDEGFGRQTAPEFNVVAIDYGIKRNILRLLAGVGCKVTVVPATTSAEDILALKPDGVFLSNGPGDPAATGKYAVPVIRKVISSGTPTFGICLGHQMLGLAVGAKTKKMHQGHHGANHPVKDETTGKVEITSMNHGFAVDQATLPKGATQTHISLFDGSNCGIALDGKPVFSVQYHPEASPGPRDSHYLFQRFAELMREKKRAGVSGSIPRRDQCPGSRARAFASVAAAGRRNARFGPRLNPGCAEIRRVTSCPSSRRRSNRSPSCSADDGLVPNNPMPFLVYKGAVEGRRAAIPRRRSKDYSAPMAGATCGATASSTICIITRPCMRRLAWRAATPRVRFGGDKRQGVRSRGRRRRHPAGRHRASVHLGERRFLRGRRLSAGPEDAGHPADAGEPCARR